MGQVEALRPGLLGGGRERFAARYCALNLNVNLNLRNVTHGAGGGAAAGAAGRRAGALCGALLRAKPKRKPKPKAHDAWGRWRRCGRGCWAAAGSALRVATARAAWCPSAAASRGACAGTTAASRTRPSCMRCSSR